jgi:hypothetical protein
VDASAEDDFRADLDRRLLVDTWVWGPDGDHLVGYPAGAVHSPRPVRTAYAIGDVLLQGIELCGLRCVVVAAAPGTTGRASWISDHSPAAGGAEHPGGALVRPILRLHLNGSNLPVPPSDPQVLWSGRAGSGWTAVVGSSTLPGVSGMSPS